MEKDELLKRVLMMQRLQGMESKPVSAEDPYASMEKDQLISMIHFLVKREDERAQEVQELKDMIRELKDTHKEDVKTRQSLLKAIDDLTRRLADSDAENKELRQEIKNLLSRISVGNKVRFGSTSQKGTKKKATPVQDREKDKVTFGFLDFSLLAPLVRRIANNQRRIIEPAKLLRTMIEPVSTARHQGHQQASQCPDRHRAL